MTTLRNQGSTLSIEEKRALIAKLLKEKVASGSPWAGFPRMFEAQVAKTPEAVAIAMDALGLTYRELDVRANRLAHRLRSLGVGPETLVGVCLERSPEMLVALLGVMKAGAAYVPLDPAFPERRLALMLDDARVPVLVTQQSLCESIPAGNARILCVDSEWEGFEELSETAPAVLVASENLAYVLYTSGSTGRPKGVQVSHGALVNFLRAMRGLLEITNRDVLLAVTTLSFDIAGLELFLPLIAGARIELVSREIATDGSKLAARMSAGDVTMLQATPATWRLLLDGGWDGSPSLTMLCGGEALSRSLADRLLAKGKGLWNLYGPTETTIWSSAWRVEPGDAPIAIGGPIAQTRLVVLDGRMRPVPVGVTGELFIGGQGVARGYLNLPGLTAERFVPDPFAKAPGSRLYRTGDLARWRSDGTLECLGRIDEQVKIRGFRVELGEIESALANHPSVREAAVVAREDASGENALVAYWSARPGVVPDAAELRRTLGETLPEYMVPATFMVLDNLPLTPNGKIDRKALPDPLPDHDDSGLEYVPPRGPIEEAVVAIWSELLGRDRVGVHDNFFDLGGHSLFATQLIARLRDTFAVEPSLREFLDEPTVAGLSRLVERAMTAGAGLDVPPIRPVDRGAPIPASFAQQRLWFLDQLEPGSAIYNIPTAVRLLGDLDVPALDRALGEIVLRHEPLRTTFAERHGIPSQLVATSLDLRLPVDDLTAVREADRESEARRLLEQEAQRPFDLLRGPLIRAILIRLGDREHIVSVTMHHIISDGWSIGVLIHEVAALYDAFRDGRPSPLPGLPLQYADYAAWQRDWLQGEVLDGQIDYWTSRLGTMPALDLPTDLPRLAVASSRGAERSIPIAKETLAAVRAIGREVGATLYMTLLAAFQVLLHRYSGQDRFAVGSPIAGRTRSELEGLIGLFVNTLVLPCDLSGDPSFRVLLKRVRHEALGAYAHQDLPFDQIVNALHLDRDSGRSPLFQAMFVLQNAPLPIPQSSELEIAIVDSISGTAKFDLTLYLMEREDGPLAIMEYRTELFAAGTIDRMLGHFRTILEGIAADPEQAVGSISMLSQEERRLLFGTEDDDEDDLDAMLMDLSSGEAFPDA